MPQTPGYRKNKDIRSKRARNGQLTVEGVNSVLGKLEGQRVSNVQIQEIARGYAVECIETLVDIMRHGKMDNSRLGAAKALLNKVSPDLKAVEINDTSQLKGLVIIKQDTSAQVVDGEVQDTNLPTIL